MWCDLSGRDLIAGFARRAAALAALSAVGFSPPLAAQASGVSALIPLPASISPAPSGFQLTDGTRVVVPPSDPQARFAAEVLGARVATDRGLKLVVTEGASPGGGVAFVRGPATLPGAEAYDLTVAPTGVRITALSDAGLFYGAMTLAQLLSPDARFGAPVTLAGETIHDAPRFVWRGLMIDVARHFQPVDALRAVIDQMAAHKMNVLHLHLTDDQGWRLEIKRYPELTRIGAWRTSPTGGGPPGPRVGGFYTQVEMRALIAYAAARHVVIVPEIDVPGHAQAVVAAYPEIGVFGDRPPVGVNWGVSPYLLRPDARGMSFVRNVLDEVMAVFPSTFIHLGGDEAIKDQWKLSPQVQALMAKDGVTSEDALQSRLVEELGLYLAAHGRRLIGWDEILQGGLPPTASIMSWRGEQGAIEAANAGHDVVLSPAPTLYLDNLQSTLADETPGRIGPVTLADVYAYDPMPAAIAADKASHVLGAQGNVWSENVVTPLELEHDVFPRLDALAEIDWSPKAARDWPGFQARLAAQLPRYAREGVTYADSAFAVAFTPVGGAAAAARAGHAQVAMGSQADYGAIRFTLNGAEPNAASPIYKAPVSVPGSGVVRAARFAPDGQRLSAVRAFDTSLTALLTKASDELPACPPGRMGQRVHLGPDDTAPGPTFDIEIEDTCAIYPAAPLDLAQGFVIRAARLPRHYGLAHDFEKVKVRFNATRFGELIVRVGGCAGKVAASFPLPDPDDSDPRMRFQGQLPPGGRGDADLCLTFTWPPGAPSYAVERMELIPREGSRARS